MVRWLGTLYVEVFRSVPTLLLVYAFLFALPGLGLNLPLIAGKPIVPIILINAAAGRRDRPRRHRRAGPRPARGGWPPSG